MAFQFRRGRLRTLLLLVSLLAAFHSTHSTNYYVLIATPLLILGVVVNFWAKGCLRQNSEVSQGGPYRFVRHPFYVGSLFIDTGIALMSGWLPLWIAFPFVWAAVYVATMRREEKYLLETFPEQYGEYRRLVPAFFPFRRPLPNGPGGFSWRSSNVVRTESYRAFRTLSLPVVFLALNEIRSRDFFSGPRRFALAAALAGAFLLLRGISWTWRRATRR